MGNPQAKDDRSRARERGDGAYSVADFAKVFGLGRTSIYREIKSGRLRAIKAGFRTLIKRADAQDWLDSLSPVAPGRGDR